MEDLKRRNILAALKEIITISWGGKTRKYHYRDIWGGKRVEMSKKCYKDNKEISLVKGSCWRIWKNEHIQTVDQVNKDAK